MNQTHPSIEQIVDYLHGELPPAQDAAMHAHLAACGDCEKRRSEELAITEALRAHAQAAEREMPETLVARIRRSAVQPSAPRLSDRLRNALRPLVLVPAAAALAAVLYFGTNLWSDRTTTRIDAASYIENHTTMAATAPFADDMPMLTTDDETR